MQQCNILLKIYPDYNSKNILVFGLGKMGKHTCKNLAEYTQNKSVCLINRTEEKAIQNLLKNTNQLENL